MEKQTILTVKDLSNELNVTRQTVYNKINEIKRETPENEHYKYFKTIQNTLNITQAGIKRIYEKLGFQYDSPTDETDPQLNDTLLEVITTLQEQLKVKDEQLGIKDQQIKDLTETIKAQQESITTQLKTDRERGYTKALETQIKALESSSGSLEDDDGKGNILKRVWSAIKGG